MTGHLSHSVAPQASVSYESQVRQAAAPLFSEKAKEKEAGQAELF